MEWTNYEEFGPLSTKIIEEIKKREEKLACVDQDTKIGWEELEWVMQFYEQEGKAVVPLPGKRPHRFDIGNHRIPRTVLTPRHVSHGVGAPFHDYFEKICKWFDFAPIQLSPNSYKLAAGLYIFHKDLGFEEPTKREISYYFRISRSALGYHFLVVRHEHNNRGFSEGRVSHVKKWKEPFFYVYNTKRVRIQLNKDLIEHPITDLDDNEFERARQILELPHERKNMNQLASLENLIRVGLLSENVGSKVEFKNFINGRAIKKRKGQPKEKVEPQDEDKDDHDSKDASLLYLIYFYLCHMLTC